MKTSTILKGYFLFTCFIFGPTYLEGQVNASQSSYAFEESIKLVKGSILYHKDTSYILNNDLEILINKKTPDTLFYYITSNQDELNSNASSTLTPISSPISYFSLISGENYVQLKYTDWDIHPLTIPMKIRPAIDGVPVQFTGDVAIGPYIGYQWGRKKYYDLEETNVAYTIALFSSPSLININASNSSITDNSGGGTLGISAGMGLLLDISTYQFGIVSGFDWVSGSNSKVWNYQGKPWLSFSLGYQLNNN